MNRTSAFILATLFLAAAAFGQDAKPFSVFARSQHYSMNVDVVPQPGGSIYDYNVTIVDLATNTVVAQPHMLSTSRSPAEIDSGDVHIRIQVVMLSELFTSFEISKGDTVIDSIRTNWTVVPYRLGAASPVGGVVFGDVVRSHRPLPPDTYRVGGDVRAPIVVNRVEPVYPEQARKDRIAGVVILEALIDKTGVVRDVTILKNLPEGLGEAAVDAVKQWRFKPATRNGEPVDVVFNLTVMFKLQGVEPQ
jgi:TonB family protein